MEAPGLDTFPGRCFHMHVFRTPTPDDFHDKTVVIIGNHVSGNDLTQILIMKEGRTVEPRQIFMTGRHDMGLPKSEDYAEFYASGKLVIPQGGVREIRGSTVEFVDG